MTIGGSQQLRLFRRAMRDGQPVEIAAQIAGIELGEARLHAAEDAKNPPPAEALELLSAPSTKPADEPASSEKGVHMSKAAAQFEPEPNDDPLVQLATDTLRGDARDSILAWFKAQPKSWPFMAEREQRDLAEAADAFSATLIREITSLIAAQERPTIMAKLVEYREKDGIEAKIKISPTSENIVALHKACGKAILLVASGAEDYLGEGGPADIDSDQPDLPDIGGEYDDQ